MGFINQPVVDNFHQDSSMCMLVGGFPATVVQFGSIHTVKGMEPFGCLPFTTEGMH